MSMEKWGSLSFFGELSLCGKERDKGGRTSADDSSKEEGGGHA
jgi:hypothetical protein